MAKRKTKVAGTDDYIEIDEPEGFVPEEDAVEVTEEGKPKAPKTPPVLPVDQPAVQTVDDPSNPPKAVPGPGEPGSPFGDTSQRYEGEVDVGSVIKARNIQRAYEQAGLPPPIPGQPTTPEITSIDPTEAEIGGSDLELTVTGKYFSPGSSILFNGGVEPTTLNADGTEATTIVKPSLASTPGSYPVQIKTAANVESNSVDFTFTEPVVRGAKKK
jgi:hypothetical protein